MRKRTVLVMMVAAAAGAVAVFAGTSIAGMLGDQGHQDPGQQNAETSVQVRSAAIIAETPGGPPSMLGHWRTQDSKTVAEMKGAFAGSKLNAWLVGGSGGSDETLNGHTVVRHTTDGGVTWREDTGSQNAQTLAAGHTLQSGFAVGNTVWIIGENNENCVAGEPSESIIMRSTNGGLTWTQQKSNTCSDIESMFMLDAHNGVIGGGDDSYLRTTNGGATWTSYSLPTSTEGCDGDIHAAVWFPPAHVPWNQRTGWGAGGCGIWRTTNGGQTWTEQAVDAGYGSGGWEDIDCPTTTSCIATNDNNYIAWYNSGAGTWSTTGLEGFGENPDGDLMGAIMFNANLAYVVGEGDDAGTMFVTQNGGANWYEIVPPGGLGSIPGNGAFRYGSNAAWVISGHGDVAGWLSP